jgi:hypothetical protein
MECVGSWVAPDNLAQFKSALSLVHVSRGQDGPYSEACTDCVSGLAAAENPQQYLGCDFHHPSRRITRQGNPMTYQLFLDIMKAVYVEKASYIQKGDSPITPKFPRKRINLMNY